MKKWKAVVGVVVVFLLGMAAGSLITFGVTRQMFQWGHGPQARTDFIVRKLSWELWLDGQQREQLRSIVQDAQQEMKPVRQQVRPQVEAILDRADAKVRAILRPNQIEKFDKLVAERKAKWSEAEK
jgi:Spy/CpxP family protein refolding chaperone